MPAAGRLLITLGFTALLLALSVSPGEAQPGDSGFIWLVAATPPTIQKLLHVVLYAALTSLWVWTLQALGWDRAKWIAAPLLAVSFGALMEALQLMIPGRFGSLYDVLLNSIGAGLGLLAAMSVCGGFRKWWAV